jgi:DNA topoisomerase-1
MELFKMPRDLGAFEEKPVVVNIGRFGPYVLHDKKFVSIPKDNDPYEISLEKAVELIQNKRIADANKLIKAFPENADIQVLNGRFGPYIKAGKKNVKIPKGKEPVSLTLEECVELAANTPEKVGRFGRRKAAAGNATVAAEAPVKTPRKTTPKKAAKTAKVAKKTAKPAKKIAAKKTATKIAAKKKS